MTFSPILCFCLLPQARLCKESSRFESRIAHRLPKSITMFIFLFTTCGDLLTSSPDVFCVLARSSYPHSPHLLLSFLRLQLSYLMSPGWATYLRVQLCRFCLQAELSSSPTEISSAPVELPPSPGWPTYIHPQMTFLRLSYDASRLLFELYLRLQRTYLQSSHYELIRAVSSCPL